MRSELLCRVLNTKKTLNDVLATIVPLTDKITRCVGKRRSAQEQLRDLVQFKETLNREVPCLLVARS